MKDQILGYYLILQNSDGSASARFFTSSEKAEAEYYRQELEDSGIVLTDYKYQTLYASDFE